MRARAGARLSPRRVRTATVLQYEAVECGAASLKIILAHFGRVLSLEELRERCGISRDGVTALQLKRAAQGLHLEVRAFRCRADHLRRQGRFPCVLFWNFNHFLVLEGFRGERACLSDPASGRREVSWPDFQGCFTGVVLELEPGEGFRRGGRESSPYGWLPGLLPPYRPLLLWLPLIALAAALPELFIAGATSQFIDAFLEEGRQNIAIPVVWITALAALALIALLTVQKLLLRLLSHSLLKRVSSLLYISLFSLPYRFFLQRLRGEISGRLLLPISLVQLSVGGVADFVLSLGSGLLALMVGLLISPWLALLTLAISGGNALLTLALRQLRRGENYRLAMAQGKAQAVAMYVLQCIESIKASGLENEAFVEWAAKFNESLAEVQRQSLATSLLGLIGTTSGFLLRCSVILLGGLLIIAGQISLGELMAFQFLMGMMQAPLQQLSLLGTQLQQLDGEVGRLNDVIDSSADPLVRSFSLTAVDEPPRTLAGALELQDLLFQFSATSPPLFGGLSLSLAPGQHLAIVGASGSGKSTLLRLIAGLFPPTGGRVLYDGRPWLDWDDATLRHSLALVSQDVFLFPATLEQNLTLWDPRFRSSDAIEALQQAALLEELGGAGALALPLVEAGANLSGGQRQRVEIARALLRRPSLLLMDEATSALDGPAEHRILEAVKRPPRTLITVAHRLQAALISDLVLVLERGQPVELGPPALLARQEGPFRRLLAAESPTPVPEDTP